MTTQPCWKFAGLVCIGICNDACARCPDGADDVRRALRAEEDAWGEHPECPVEVLPTGERVWRVLPGTEVDLVTRDKVFRVVITDTQWVSRDGLQQAGAGFIGVRVGRQLWWSHWKFLRRIDYNPPPTREEAHEAADAAR